MIRVFDVIFSLFGLIFLSPLFLIIFIVGWFVNGSPIFKQKRIGHKQNPFVMLKFRTMKPGTVSVATHLLDEMSNSAFERFLRRTKLDELPQLLNVLYGEMSLVGPRPCLLDQVELIHLRDQLRVFEARPGITGLAQIQGIDMSSPSVLAELDAKMLKNLNILSYFSYIFVTIVGKKLNE